jgi:hypothetical protein
MQTAGPDWLDSVVSSRIAICSMGLPTLPARAPPPKRPITGQLLYPESCDDRRHYYARQKPRAEHKCCKIGTKVVQAYQMHADTWTPLAASPTLPKQPQIHAMSQKIRWDLSALRLAEWGKPKGATSQSGRANLQLYFLGHRTKYSTSLVTVRRLRMQFSCRSFQSGKRMDKRLTRCAVAQRSHMAG